MFSIPVPVVWSPDGPVPCDFVEPVNLLHSYPSKYDFPYNTSLCKFFQAQSLSKLQFNLVAERNQSFMNNYENKRVKYCYME